MLSKNKIKFIRSLHTKKGREAEKCFIAEGERIVNEIIESETEILFIVATKLWIEKNYFQTKHIEIIEVEQNDLSQISTLSTPQQVLCIARVPNTDFCIENIKDELTLALDSVQDPGNMGTIIRLANWFGIKTILCSHSTVDAFNPKVVQASMGGICRVQIVYDNLSAIIAQIKEDNQIPVYGTFLEGENVYETKLTNNGIVVLGNEGNGISQELEQLITRKISIPSFSQNNVVESLNVSIAAAILCSEFRRR